MTRPTFLVTCLVAMACSGLGRTGPTAVGAVQAERERIDVSSRGPQVGESIPDFTLRDQYGRTWTRESILGRNGAMLVFLRSADW